MEDGEAAYEVLATYKGTDLEGKEYDRCISVLLRSLRNSIRKVTT